MKKAVFFMLVSAMLFGFLGCGEAAAVDILKSDKPRDTAPMVAGADLIALVDGNNAFAFDLYRALSQEDGNLFFSPYSISEALAMTYTGARGQTEADMASALSFLLSQDRLHPAFNSLDLQLSSRGKGAQGQDGEGFRLNVVNAIWGQRDYQFLAEFLDTLAENYGAGLRILDFINQTEESRITINDWVSEQTEGKIEGLIPQGAIDIMTRLVLTNAIYFNAAWQYPFEEEATADGTFYLLGGGEVTVPMMMQSESFRYARGDGYQAVELPYDGRELSMVILLPEDGQFSAFEQSLDAELVEAIIREMGTKEVALTMPKFEYEASLGLKETLSTLGMGVAFTGGADFSGMDGTRGLMIQDVLHKAFVSVNEAGTEAAAATAVIMGRSSMPERVEMKVDRSFLFLIRDIETGSIIFVGRVFNPAG
ncbi:serpin family protein [Chloroflexota bacterium]